MEELKIGNVVVEKPTITDNMRILQALDCVCEKGSGLCNNCEFFTGNGFEECIRNVSIAAIDLIHRLQSENETQRKIIEYQDSLQDEVAMLKEERENMQAEIMRFEDMKFTQEHCDLYSENEFLKKGLQEQMAEIERLTEENGWLSKECNKATTECAELQKEIERWKEEYSWLDCKCQALQKQVDEYKNKIEQGTLIELPCKVGDTVYWRIANIAIIECVVILINISVGKKTHFSVWAKQKREGVENEFSSDDLGDEWFTSREKAEKRLKELQE